MATGSRQDQLRSSLLVYLVATMFTKRSSLDAANTAAHTTPFAPLGNTIAPSFEQIASMCPALALGFSYCRPMFGTLG
jgi:hypothetical protein